MSFLPVTLNTKLQSMYYKDVQHMTVSGKTSGHNPKQWKKNFDVKETTCTKSDDLNSRKMNAEEEEYA